ncbi:AAA family ATPase [Paraburkholderia sp. SARCC-3016]|uniref:trifunctional serine/threonine-protein kinase/ATP-binding protein/sensor histidine kinase n=1 Tax=Paraburkholderia sp. SARCC-3016 TaxID=3058611 RepID=UPI00280831C3|nr:AAA family ATPase [Paraburkholderia sp. SARCC-3016]MDQ7978293.1 AAA family ATPase [Paraburkholderia sp. SARCC-3016]
MIDLSTRSMTRLFTGAQPLFRAWKPGSPPVLIAGAATEDPAEIAALQREYAIRASLDDDWASVPLGLITDTHGTRLVLNDPGGEPLTVVPGRMPNVEDFLERAISLADTVNAMHAAGLVHRAIIPARFLIANDGTARLYGFGWASRSAETSCAAFDPCDAASLPYMSPELGARMNLSVDRRADLYSLGCVFYEMLAGVTPFAAVDPAALIHAHASCVPRHIDELRRDVPRQVSLVVMRLLEKAPDARYTNAAGLIADLRRCGELMRRHGDVPCFPLDIHTELYRLQQADCIFGREEEVAAAVARYRALQDDGTAQIMWISGPPGIGKTTLLTEIERRIRGIGSPLIVFGTKGEGLGSKRYAMAIRLIEQLLHYVAGCPDDEYLRWRERIETAVAADHARLSPLLPTLSATLRPVAQEKAVPAMNEDELIAAAMARLIACFAMHSRRLLLLIDDLQWADPATLRVLEQLLTCRSDGSICLIGAFRVDDIGTDHPLRSGALAKARTSPDIELGPLSDVALLELMSRTLGQDSRLLAPLSKEIGRDTGGNPFFVHQSLRLLADDGLLEYDVESAAWRWSLVPIASRPDEFGITNHFEARLARLPSLTLKLLRVLACLGPQARSETLAIAAGIPDSSLARELEPALEAGCVAREGNDWVLQLERAREIAYASIPVADRAPLHLQIARRLLSDAASNMDVFDLAGQANLARAAVKTRGERIEFGGLCLAAGRRAMTAAACHTALAHLRAALDFFGEDDTGEDALNARRLCSEAEIMTGAFETAESRLASLAVQVNDDLFGADVARLRVELYMHLERFERALEVGLGFLARAGIVMPAHPRVDEVEDEWRRFSGWLDRRGVDGLRALPDTDDRRQRALAVLLSDLFLPALLARPDMSDLLVLRTANIAVRMGLSDVIAIVLPGVSRIAIERYGNPALAKAMAQATLDFMSERGLDRFGERAYMMSGVFAVPWIWSARNRQLEARQAFDVAVGSGDRLLAGYCATHEAGAMLFAGDFLGDVLETLTRGLSLDRNRRSSLARKALHVQRELVAQLRDIAAHNEVSRDWDDDRMPATEPVFGYWVYRMQAALLFDDLPKALQSLAGAEQCGPADAGFAQTGELFFYGALTLLALRDRDANGEAALARYVDLLSRYAQAYPASFDARYELVKAEILRARGDAAEASAGYARAVRLARSHEFIQVEALACELAGRFHAGRAESVPAQAYLRQAYMSWQRWGATARADWLIARHPELSVTDAVASAPRNLHRPDVRAVLRISCALASNIVPERLVETFLETALEVAGGARGALLSCRDGVWLIQAQAQMQEGAITFFPRAVALSSEVLPVSLIHAVIRKQDGVVIDDLRDEPAYAHDEYVRRQQPRSALCIPLVRYASLVGVLYLENNLAPKVFTPAKAALMEVLASQTAFALENARLYDSLREENRQRAQAEEQLRAALTELAIASRLKAMGELVASIVHEVSQPVAAIDTSASAALRWLDRDDPQVEEAKDILRNVSLSAARAAAIIQALRAKAKRPEPLFARVDLSDALHEVATLVAAPLESLQVNLQLRASADPIYVRGDRIQLQQVAINLLMNGAESMAAIKGRPRRLFLDWGVAADGSICVTVDDEGCGIAPDVADRMLEPLFTTKESGMGMGLAICNSIVDAHGGTLILNSRELAGTRATFTLPAWFG